MHGVILAAGLGSRLGADRPKALVELAPHETCLSRILRTLHSLDAIDDVLIVVGHEAARLRAAAPGCRFVENPHYESTNTAASLLGALEVIPPEADALWINGDVCMDDEALDLLVRQRSDRTRMLVRAGVVDSEDVQVVAREGAIERVGKKLGVGATGEALGANAVIAADRPALQEALRGASPEAYFEDAIDQCLRAGALRVAAVDVGTLWCEEVDTPADLERVRARLRETRSRPSP